MGDGTSLYTTDADLPVHTPEEWAKHYENMNFDYIANEAGIDRVLGFPTKGGPNLNWRFVILKDFRILDMRHVLVIGMRTKGGIKIGVPVGAAVEILQIVGSPASGNSRQDYFSNKVGSEFLDYLHENSPNYNPRNSTQAWGNTHESRFAQYFLEFINQRR